MSRPQPNAEAKRLSQAQFGANAEKYATSTVHARGASLARMVELAEPAPDWVGVDLATAAGHTAFQFAPKLATMIASDLTPEMVELARRRATDLAITNVLFAQLDSEWLPFGDATLDLVTCRIAPHHFPDPAAFVGEAARVLRSGGVFALVDNIVPDDAATAGWYNDWERRRDPSHVRCLSMTEWSHLITAAGLEIAVAETAGKRMAFRAWCDNMSVPDPVRVELLRDLLAAPAGVAAFLDPSGTTEDTAEFVLTEGLVIARRS